MNRQGNKQGVLCSNELKWVKLGLFVNFANLLTVIQISGLVQQDIYNRPHIMELCSGCQII